jgi:hypothetical protein
MSEFGCSVSFPEKGHCTRYLPRARSTPSAGWSGTKLAPGSSMVAITRMRPLHTWRVSRSKQLGDEAVYGPNARGARELAGAGEPDVARGPRGQRRRSRSTTWAASGDATIWARERSDAQLVPPSRALEVRYVPISGDHAGNSGVDIPSSMSALAGASAMQMPDRADARRATREHGWPLVPCSRRAVDGSPY